MRARDSYWSYPFVMALIVLGACTKPDAAPADEPGAGEPEAVAAEPEAAPPAEAVEEPAEAVEEPAEAVEGPAQETQWPGVTVQVTEFARKGRNLSAKLRFTNNGTKDARPDFYYRDTYVLDEDNRKFEVLKDEKGGYLGSASSGYNYWWGESIEPGASRMVWMRFEAPPAEVKTMTLQVGTMDPFEDVAIQN